MKNENLVACLIFLIVISYKSNNKAKTEKFQKHRNKIINVSDLLISVWMKRIRESSLILRVEMNHWDILPQILINNENIDC